MDQDQRRFFTTWVEHWNKGQPLPVHGNISYLFCFTYEVLALPFEQAIPHLARLIDAYENEVYFANYCRLWMSECYVLLGEYRMALDVYPSIPIGASSGARSDSLLSLKVQVGDHLSGRDIVALKGPKVTAWGKTHVNEVVAYLDIIVRAYEKHEKVNLLDKWKMSSHKYPYHAFTGALNSHWCFPTIPCYSFSRNNEVIQFVEEKTRDAENSVREELNVPRVGEGWIGETELYYAIRDALSEANVVQHARPRWLGRQHLDVFIPEFAVALEYQGPQHDEAIEYFGGEGAYLATRRRDARKRRLCAENGVHVIEVRPGYNLQEVIESICQFKRTRDEVQ